MKHIRTLGLLTLATSLLAVFAGTASATTLTSPEGTAYTGTIAAESTNVALDGPFNTIECGESTFEGTVEAHGTAVAGEIGSFSFSECNYEIVVTAGFIFTIHSIFKWTYDGLRIHTNTSLGKCEFASNGSEASDFTGGSPATLDTSMKLARTGGSFLCGSSATWTGTYTFTTPSQLYSD